MRRTMVRASTAILAMAGVGGALGAGAAGAGTLPGHIGPNQFFIGTLNSLPSSAKLNVLCPGPSRTGHALPNQPLQVNPPGPTPASNLGFTGSRARAIVADLGAATTTSRLATFTRYGSPVAFPTSVPVPCSGTGVVHFAPAPGSRSARAYNLTVTFVNIGV